jgi:hypothetical protein
VTLTVLDITIGGIGALTSFAAGVFWLWASVIVVPANIDTFIGVLQRIGRINAYGAWCACAAALCAAYVFLRSVGVIL